MKCKKHCNCYEKILEGMRKGAELTNAKLTSEQRSKNAKKGWKKRNKKE